MIDFVKQLSSFLTTPNALIDSNTAPGSSRSATVINQNQNQLTLTYGNDKQIQLRLSEAINLSPGEKLRFNDTSIPNKLQLQFETPKTVQQLVNIEMTSHALKLALLKGDITGKVAALAPGILALSTTKGDIKLTSNLELIKNTPLTIKALNLMTISKLLPANQNAQSLPNLSNLPVQVLSSQAGKLLVDSKFGQYTLQAPLNFKPGTYLNLAIAANGKEASLQWPGSKLLAAELTGKIDAIIAVKVEQPLPTPVATQTNSSTLSKLMRLLLPIQQPLAQTLTELEITSAPGVGKALPNNLLEALRSVQRLIPKPQYLSRLTGSQLQAMLSFMTSQAIGSEQGSARPSLQQALLNIAATLQQNGQQADSLLKLPKLPFFYQSRAIASLIQNASFVNQLQVVPFANHSGMVFTREYRVQVQDWLKQLGDVSKSIDAGLARQQVLHLQLNKPESQINTLNFELPIHWKDKIEAVDVSIQKKNNPKKPKQSQFIVSLSFDLERLGKIKALIDVTQEKTINTAFYCEQEDTQNQFKQHMERLRTQLQNKGIVLEKGSCQRVNKFDASNNQCNTEGLINTKA